MLEVLVGLRAGLPHHRPLALALDGTSGTLLLTDARGRPLGPALMYDDTRARDRLAALRAAAPPEAPVHSPSASLAKLLHLRAAGLARGAAHALHQAEWLSGRLGGFYDRGDENNCLKLGYDPLAGRWPAWMDALGIPRGLLPRVVPAGTPLGTLRPDLARRLGLPPLLLVAGTTDSSAATLAAGASAPGEGVTSLGSTLVLKLISHRPLFDAAHGIYSHRVLGRWQVGGASNSGGAVLRRFFDDAEMAALEPRLRPDRPTGLHLYPLNRPGERFPRNDPRLAPRLEPLPEEPAQRLQALLEGIAEIEREGYALLERLGAPRLQRVFTAGGGARNRPWQAIRHHQLGVPVVQARHTEAAYGAALLARAGHHHEKRGR